MAHRKNVRTEHDGELVHIYNVTSPVGVYACPNRKDDVMLVQFLVKTYFKGPENEDAKPGANLTVNGIFDTSTLVYLKAFTGNIGRKGILLARDGRIDPCGDTSKGKISRLYSKIYVLSRAYWDFMERSGEESRYFNLDKESSPDVPALLKASVGPFDPDNR